MPENNSEHAELSDEEILVRACELLKVRLSRMQLPNGNLRSADSVESRMILAVLASRQKAVFEMLRVFLAELKKQPEYEQMDNKVELLLRMFRSFLRGEMRDIEKLLSKQQMKEDDLKHSKYADEVARASSYVRLSTVASVSTLVLLMIILVVGSLLVRNANEKAQKWEDEYLEMRRKFAPFIEALTPEKSATSSPANQVTVTKTSSASQEKKQLEAQKFYAHMEEKLQLPSAIDFMKVYTQHYDAKKDTYDEKALRSSILRLILGMDGNRAIFRHAVEQAIQREVLDKEVQDFIDLLGNDIALPSSAELLKIYSEENIHDQKRRKIIQALIQLPHNKRLIDEQLTKLFQH